MSCWRCADRFDNNYNYDNDNDNDNDLNFEPNCATKILPWTVLIKENYELKRIGNIKIILYG